MPVNQLNSMNPNDFLKTTFRICDLTEKPSQTTFTLNVEMVRILVALDGKASMVDIARKINLSGERIKGYAEKLFSQGLIEIVEIRANVLDAAFYDYLSAAMARLVGPIAPIVINDAIAGLGYQKSGFPVDRVAELINALSMEIQEKDKRLAFQKHMIKVLKDKGYLKT